MQIGLAQEIDVGIEHLSASIADLDSQLEAFFLERNYGVDVEHIFIGIILVAPDSEKLHPFRKLKYRKSFKMSIPGHTFEKKNVIEYDVKPDYMFICRLNIAQARQYLAQVLIESTEILERQKAKYPAFDVMLFRQDFQFCLKDFVN